jgi:hypothetical protein
VVVGFLVPLGTVVVGFLRFGGAAALDTSLAAEAVEAEAVAAALLLGGALDDALRVSLAAEAVGAAVVEAAAAALLSEGSLDAAALAVEAESVALPDANSRRTEPEAGAMGSHGIGAPLHCSLSSALASAVGTPCNEHAARRV